MIRAAFLVLAIASVPNACLAVDSDPTIDAFREGLMDSFNKGDVDRMMTYLTDDVVATWQNGEVTKGPAAVKAFYERIYTGDKRIVDKVTCAPTIDGRVIRVDQAFSWGAFHDSYVLRDGSDLVLNSRFSALLVKKESGWKIAGFHASANVFDNPVTDMQGKLGKVMIGSIAGLGGVVVGTALGLTVGRRRGAKPMP